MQIIMLNDQGVQVRQVGVFDRQLAERMFDAAEKTLSDSGQVSWRES